MAIERDHAAERSARVEKLLTEAKRTAAGRAPSDRAGAPDACALLDTMLADLDASVPARPAAADPKAS
jgi:hypothetical protein